MTNHLRQIDAVACFHQTSLDWIGVGAVMKEYDAASVPLGVRRRSISVKGPFLCRTEASIVGVLALLGDEPDLSSVMLVLDQADVLDPFTKTPPYAVLRDVRAAVLTALARFRARVNVEAAAAMHSGAPSVQMAKRLAARAEEGTIKTLKDALQQ